MTVCASCGEGFTPGEIPHDDHEPDCTKWHVLYLGTGTQVESDYCDCSVKSHARCCRVCAAMKETGT